jgi:hypothetical protein
VAHTNQRWLALALLGAACKSEGSAPELGGIDDQLAAVGTELVIDLRAEDPDGDEIEYGFFSELDGIDSKATITRRADGGGVFRWTPLAEDVGLQYFDFTASDGRHTDTVTVAIDVRSTLGEGTVPVFREPLGSGTTLDLEQSACVEFPVIVDDQDDTDVALGIEPPGIVGAELVADSGLAGTFSWCPTKEQMADERHPVVLSADDGDHAKVLKNFLIVLRKAPNPDCPGEAPVIEHDAVDISTVLDVEIAARISDDVGLKQAPLLYFSLVEPHVPVDFSELDVVEMTLDSGDMIDGQWSATIENPVAAAPEGTSAPIWYLISAGDNDDAAGDCDHVTDAPADGLFMIDVTNGGGTGELPICAPCSADAQCGGEDDLCVPLGAANDGFCGSDCDTAEDCDADFACEPVESKDGVVAKQCVPVSGECEVGPKPCEDDAFEDNDTRQQAQAEAALAPDSYENLVSCGDDEDWYRVIIDEDSTLGAVIEGGAASNLNLGLLDSSGVALEVAEGPDSSEVVETCVPAGTYYVRVYSFDGIENTYDLLVDATPETCAAVCEDDDLEEDDVVAQATYAEVVGGYEITDRMLCANDDDWYEIHLADDERVEVDLTFVDDGPLEDLDLHFHDADGVDLTPCTEQMPATCTAMQGQGASSNEHYEFTLDDPACTPGDLCTFYVRVHGFGGSQNSYDLAIEWFLAN